MFTTVIIVDSHPLIRFGIRTLLEKNDYRVVDEAGTGIAAIKSIREHQPNIVVMDICIPQLDGVDILRRLPPSDLVKYLIITNMTSIYNVDYCLQHGVSGLVAKDAELSLFIDAISAIRSGHSFFPDMGSCLRSPSMLSPSQNIKPHLSVREIMILEHLVSGKRNKDIAELLVLSEKTISTYRTRINKKLGTQNLVELINLTKRHKLF